MCHLDIRGSEWMLKYLLHLQSVKVPGRERYLCVWKQWFVMIMFSHYSKSVPRCGVGERCHGAWWYSQYTTNVLQGRYKHFILSKYIALVKLQLQQNWRNQILSSPQFWQMICSNILFNKRRRGDVTIEQTF